VRPVLFIIMAGIALSASSGHAFDPVLQLQANYSVGNGPRSICAADFNGDTYSDLVVANQFTNNISILYNLGDGAFAAAVDYAVGTEPSSVAAADLNGDTDIDLVVTNFGSDNISVLISDGSGGFADPVNYLVGAPGAAPRSICIADFDGVNQPDLAVANQWADSVAVLINNGNGTFQAAISYEVGISDVDNEPYSVCAADFDGDGFNDLAVANSLTGVVSVAENNGDGSFAAAVNHDVGELPRTVRADDLDGVSGVDLAVGNYGSHNISILKNAGAGTFGPASDYGVGSNPRSLCLVELDGDTHPDIASANFMSADVSLLLNIGNGTFSPDDFYAVGNSPTSVCSADFDKDGDNDLAVTNFDDDNVSVLMNGSDIVVDVDGDFPAENSPRQIRLDQNYPNPFNPYTAVAFFIARRSPVELSVYDVMGRVVRRLANGEMPAGHHILNWDGRDESGRPVATGVYVYRLEAGGFEQTRKMVLLR
jgi:hypothetical protein